MLVLTLNTSIVPLVLVSLKLCSNEPRIITSVRRIVPVTPVKSMPCSSSALPLLVTLELVSEKLTTVVPVMPSPPLPEMLI